VGVGDGSQTRSFCYVDDLIDGFIRLLHGDIQTPVNLGNPGEFTLLELASAVRELTGSTSPVEHHALPSDDPRQRRPDIGLAERVLGWRPKVDLHEGLRRTIESMRIRDWYHPGPGAGGATGAAQRPG
jgi:UDP-glucuronate decarboxylase